MLLHASDIQAVLLQHVPEQRCFIQCWWILVTKHLMNIAWTKCMFSLVAGENFSGQTLSCFK